MMSSNIVSVPVSIGELCDKYTILEIKAERIHDVSKREKVERELDHLKPLVTSLQVNQALLHELKDVNSLLWDIEDAIRIKELDKQFDEGFIQLARSVYITNDNRFELKSKINEMYTSELCEVKSYAKYK